MTVSHCILGLELLQNVVAAFNEPSYVSVLDLHSAQPALICV